MKFNDLADIFNSCSKSIKAEISVGSPEKPKKISGIVYPMDTPPKDILVDFRMSADRIDFNKLTVSQKSLISVIQAFFRQEEQVDMLSYLSDGRYTDLMARAIDNISTEKKRR